LITEREEHCILHGVGRLTAIQFAKVLGLHPQELCPAETVYPGMFGDWSVDDTDIAEVYGYRVGISVAALSAVAVTATMLVDGTHAVPANALNAMCVTGSLGFGVSLFLIHIYVTEIKRTIQVRLPLEVSR
jgi:hypothetical protein